MLIAALFLGLLQGQRPSAPALAAKAPDAPGYGLQITARSGKVLLTNFRFHPVTHKVQAHLFRILGPAGMGPYRLGVHLQFHLQQEAPNNALHLR